MSARRTTRTTSATIAVAAAATVLGTVAAAGPSSASPRAAAPTVAAHGVAARVAPRAVVPTAVWQKLSNRGLTGIDQPSVLRRGSSLMVAWHRQDSPLSESVRLRLINPAGQLGAAPTAVSGWAGIVHDPALVNTMVKPLVLFGGQRTTVPGQFFAGQMAASDGTTTGSAWALNPFSFGQSTNAHDSEGTAATEYQGDQINAFAGPGGTILVHQGSDPSSPASNPDTTYTEPAGSSTYDTSMAVDPRTQTVWVAWHALNSSNVGANGIRYASFLPTKGTAATAPGSHDASGSTIQPDQRVAMAGVTTGAWVAYTVGYPSGKAIRLFNLRTHRTLLVPASANSDQVGLAAGPGGRLWVFWSTSSRNVLHAVRTNAAVTRFEPQQLVATPDVPTATAGEGSPGPLDVVVNSAVRLGSNDDELFYRRIKARFNASAFVSRGYAYVTVTDAGTPVKGAVVRYGSRKAVTLANGITRILVGKAKGLRVLGVSASGYWSAVLKVRVR
jgi:hypothetical protein